MSGLLKYLLVSHIIFGLLGAVAFYAALMNLLKPIDFKKIKFLKFVSLTGFFGFILSWFSGGYYYVIYYGGSVKPVIKSGEYPWIHSILMETKEHIFIFLPFLALVAVAAIYLFKENLEQNQKIKKAVALVCAVMVAIGAVSALMGLAISGAAVN